MRSRWVVRQHGGQTYRTIGYYTRAEVHRMLASEPVRRINVMDAIKHAISKTWNEWMKR